MPIHKSRANAYSIRGDFSMYKPGEPVGKSTVQVGRTMDGSISANDSELYEKWGQCLNSANDLVERLYWDGDEDKVNYMSAVIPFVVVPNGRLWMATYDDDGNMTKNPEPTDRCSCFIDKDYKMGTELASAEICLSHVEIVPFDGMLAFVKDHLKTKNGMAKIFSSEGLVASYDS